MTAISRRNDEIEKKDGKRLGYWAFYEFQENNAYQLVFSKSAKRRFFVRK